MVKNSKPLTLELLKNILDNETKLIMIDFFAEWCGPCKRISPEIDKLEKMYHDKSVFLKIDVDKSEDIALEFSVESMPTFLFIKDGVVLKKVIGANLEAIHKSLEDLV